MQFVPAGGHHRALGVLPGSAPCAVARIDGHPPNRLDAELSAPFLGAATDRCGKLLTTGIGAGQAAKISTLPGLALVTKNFMGLCEINDMGTQAQVLRPKPNEHLSSVDTWLSP